MPFADKEQICPAHLISLSNSVAHFPQLKVTLWSVCMVQSKQFCGVRKKNFIQDLDIGFGAPIYNISTRESATGGSRPDAVTMSSMPAHATE